MSNRQTQLCWSKHAEMAYARSVIKLPPKVQWQLRTSLTCMNTFAAGYCRNRNCQNRECRNRNLYPPYLTLPFGEDVLLPSVEASSGPNVHPRINRKVTKSTSTVLTWVHTNTWNHPPAKWAYSLEPSWYLQDNISSKAHKHIHPGHHDQRESKPGNQGPFSKHTLYVISITL